MTWGLGAESAWGVPGQWVTRRWAWPAPRVCGSLVGAPSLLWLLWGPWRKQRGGWLSAETFGVEPMHLRQEPDGAQVSDLLWVEGQWEWRRGGTRAWNLGP